jgi:toxin-antitoxin system PIN domain toxin
VLLLDVNPLVYALRADVPEHRGWLAWLEKALEGPEPVGVSNATLAAVARISTHRRVFPVPTPLEVTLDFIDSVRDAPAYLPAEPGPRHWALMEGLCRKTRARGNLVMDAYIAALAIELGAELISADGDFARFPGMRYLNPVDG